MKKSVIIGKRQFVLAGLILILGLAVWLNMRLASQGGGVDISAELTSSKYLGEAQLVDNQNVDGATSDAAQVSVKDNSVITKTKTERDEKREEDIERLEDIIRAAESTGANVSEAASLAAQLIKNCDDERAIEDILAAKNFTSVVTIGERDVNVTIDAGELATSQTVLIKDAVQSVRSVEGENIKIICVK